MHLWNYGKEPKNGKCSLSSFVHTFEFVDEHPTVNATLQEIKEKIFVEIPL